MRVGPVALCLAALLLVVRASAADQTEHVYLVYIPGTRNHEPLLQTGFRLAGTKGIVTALHGVADGRRFSALTGQRTLRDLSLVAVDVDRDLALLLSKELDLAEAEGLRPAQAPPAPGAPLEVCGHPGGIDDLICRKDVRVANPGLQALRGLVPPESSKTFLERRSPSGDISVLRLEASLVPGESGAPVLNAAREVVAVVDGGLLGGVAGIAWAMPLPIKWRPVDEEGRRLGTLAALRPQDLFAIQYDPEFRLRTQIGGTWFGSLEPRESTPSLGHRQAMGVMGKVSVPLGHAFEVGGEVSWPLRDAFDSQLHTSTSERRFLRDGFFSFLVGWQGRLTRRLQVVPVGGAGVAKLQAQRLVYSRAPSPVGTVVQTQSTAHDRVTPIVTTGLDVRVRVAGSLQLVGTYRLHVLGEARDELAVRRKAQHRVGVGFQLSLQGTRP